MLIGDLGLVGAAGRPSRWCRSAFFRIRQFTAANAVAVLVGVALFGSLYFVTLYFQNIKGYSALEAGVRSMPMTLIILFVAPLAGR